MKDLNMNCIPTIWIMSITCHFSLISMIISLLLSLLVTIFLKWYVCPINRLWLSSKFPCIGEIWNPDHSAVKDIVKELFIGSNMLSSNSKASLNDFYIKENKKSLENHKKTILCLASEFGLLKLIETLIKEYDGIDVEKMSMLESMPRKINTTERSTKFIEKAKHFETNESISKAVFNTTFSKFSFNLSSVSQFF